MAWIAALVVAVPRLVDGTWSTLLFLTGAAFVAAWGAIAVHAYGRAARLPGTVRSVAAVDDARPGDGGAVELLWLAPVLIAVTSAYWAFGGTLASPESTLATYAREWRTAHADDAVPLFVSRPAPADLVAIWARQYARLHNELVTLAATSGTGSGIDPASPFDALRFEIDDDSGAGDSRVVRVQVVRRETVHDSFFGLVPTSAQRLSPVADLGRLHLSLVPAAEAPGGAWRVSGFDLLGERLGS